MRIALVVVLLFLAVPNLFAEDFDDFEDQEWIQVGDMYVPVDSSNENEAGLRGVKKSNVRLWRNGIIHYQFSPGVTQARRQMFVQACEEMSEFASVKCIPRSSERDHIYVQNTTRNICGSSFLGRRGGRQDFTIKCWGFRTIQHELMHAFGLSHEHNRMDRDDYITINWQNITPGLEHNYLKISIANTSHVLNYYDFDSIMQYDSFGGTSNGGIVMYRTDLGPNRGRLRRSNVMSFGDHYILYALYGGERPR